MQQIGKITTRRPLAPEPPPAKRSTSSEGSIALSTEVSVELSKLFVGLALPSEASEDARLTKRLYVDALADLPPTETAAVLRLFRIGELGDGKWCPKAGEIRRAIMARIERRADAERAERKVAEQMAAREARRSRGPKSDAERKRIQAMRDEFMASVG